MSTGKVSNLSDHHGKIQTQDHDMSTKPDPQNTFEVAGFLNLVGLLYICIRDLQTSEMTIKT